MYRLVFTIIMILLSFIPMYSVAEITVEELINGVNKARLTIKSGEVYSKSTEESQARKTEEEIAEYIKTVKEEELRRLNVAVDKIKFEKEYLKSYLDHRARFYRQHTNIIHTTTLFKVLNAGDLSKKQQYQYKLTHVSSPGVTIDEMSDQYSPSGDMFLLVFNSLIQLKESIGDIILTLDSPSAITFYDKSEHEGFRHFPFSGRSAYFVPSDAKHIGTENIDGVECHIMVFTTPNNRRIKIWVDPEKDYAVHRSDYMHPTIDFVYWRSIHKQFVKYKDIWFPNISVGNSFFRDGRIERTITDVIVDAEFNIDFPDKFFEYDKEYDKPQDME